MASSLFGRVGLAVLGGVAALSISAAASAETIILNYVVTNTSGSTSTFTITESLGGFSIAGPVTITGSITGTVTDLNGDTASVSSLLGGSIYTAMIDGSDVANLMTGYSFTAPGPFLSESSTGHSFTDVPLVGGVNSSIGIHLEFELSAGDSASFTSIFTVVPAPAAFVMLTGLAGVAGVGRRRQA